MNFVLCKLWVSRVLQVFSIHTCILMRLKNLAEGVAARNFEHYYMYMYIILGLTQIYRKNPDAFSSLIRDVEVHLEFN